MAPVIMSEGKKPLLANIIQARENIKRKYYALKQREFEETEMLMNNTFSYKSAEQNAATATTKVFEPVSILKNEVGELYHVHEFGK